MNKVIITGRLTADPELRQTQSGVASCRFTVAVNRRFADKNTGERQADFISCQAWRQSAEFVSKYFRKGSMICIDGTLRTGSYQDKNHSDVTHYTTDVLVENIEFCGSKKDSGQTQQSSPKTNSDGAGSNSFCDLSDFEEILSDGDVPF
ncbi:MAG: single-stranded DNA-binding protein [Ruminococcus flavefaciens]|nr:single-stranded DNA-binding protein [Ruminococcus flavefaciens]